MKTWTADEVLNVVAHLKMDGQMEDMPIVVKMLATFAERIKACDKAVPFAWHIKCPPGMPCVEMLSITEFTRSYERTENISRHVESVCGNPATITPLYTMQPTQPSTSQAEVRGESGWLIEEWDSKRNELKARWWALGNFAFGETGAWITDSSCALRFASECDAQAYIDEIGWTEAKSTHHAWDMAGRHAKPELQGGDEV